ncbi:MAG: hypothetical protein AB7L66_01055 [Gemmatimonadales bacterium]
MTRVVLATVAGTITRLARSARAPGLGRAPLAGIDLAALDYRCTERAASEHATHIVLTKGASRTGTGTS